MLEKVRSSSRNAEFGALPLLIDDCERILLELRNLVDLCMEYCKFMYECFFGNYLKMSQ